MTDAEVAALLRSDSNVVVIEAPAGCGKTFQAASFAESAAELVGRGKVLVLTHTHAACSVIAERTQHISSQIEICTLDAFIYRIASAYRIALELPPDVAKWVRAQNGRYQDLALRTANLLKANPMIADVLVRRYPVVICDEHQDSSAAQEAIALTLSAHGSKLRIFGDPMQVIPGGQGQDQAVADVISRWEALKANSVFGELEVAHRWQNTNPRLGDWVLETRRRLRGGQALELDHAVPGLEILVAENGARPGQRYQLVPANNDWRSINRTMANNRSMLCLSTETRTIDGLRATFRGRLPIWEGHTRNNLEKLIGTLLDPAADITQRSQGFVSFLVSVLSGFTASRFSNRLVQEITTPTARPRGVIPVEMARMAALINADKNHKGFCVAAAHLQNLIKKQTHPFSNIRIDYQRELDDFIRLGKFDDADEGLAEITRRRSRAHPKPPERCLSTIHKSKGLEAHTAIIFAVDGTHFPDRPAKRNLLYVALSRPTTKAVLVLSRDAVSPLVA